MSTNNVKNYFQQPGGGKDNILQLVSSKWAIDGTLVTATAAALNNAAALTPTSGTVTNTWGTAFASPVAGNVKYQQVGNAVSLIIPAINGTTVGSTQQIVSVTALPLALRPAAARNCIVAVNDGTNTVSARASIGTNGIITISKDLAGGNFAATTAVAVITTSITYVI